MGLEWVWNVFSCLFGLGEGIVMDQTGEVLEKPWE